MPCAVFGYDPANARLPVSEINTHANAAGKNRVRHGVKRSLLRSTIGTGYTVGSR